ncbi:VanZ family protein [Streptococcus zalophi]|uniref:VanZ family protein n=1 Tax=Streptococcus zalophi TaxID=640031 RepID=UPI00215BE747|nr:VanZ family protein [Streptococcus zalophi]MCR8967660.1 VanZ family protein [Streptococcus zalophi]
MKKNTIYFFDFLNIIISFVFCRWIFMDFFYFPFISIFGFPESGIDFWRPLSVIIILTFILFTILRTFYTKAISSLSVKLIYFFYVIILIYSLLFKNIGIRGFNFNLLSFISDTLTIDATVPILNILIFIPLGILFSMKSKNIIIFLLTITIIEVSQYFFYLGFFDIGDIITNVLGFIIGNLIHDSFLGEKIRTLIK